MPDGHLVMGVEAVDEESSPQLAAVMASRKTYA